MSTEALHRRLARIENLIAPEIPEDQCDPKLVEFFQTFAGGQFKDVAVPRGVSCASYIKGVLDRLDGNVIVPEKVEAGQKDKGRNLVGAALR